MTTLTILRGLPGSGKSTRARQMIGVTHIEADMYFTDVFGLYQFDPTRISLAHTWCRHMVRRTLDLGKNVVVSNTFTQVWEMCPYLNMGYPYIIETCIGEWPNIHAVPAEKIAEMRARWEPTEMLDYVLDQV